MISMATTTISISDEMRRELLKVSAELQARLGERVDYDQAIRYLFSRVKKNTALLREASIPVKIGAAETRRELRKGRGEDKRKEDALDRAYS